MEGALATTRATAGASAASADGRIAMRLRIGITGHRRLPADEAALAAQVRAALERIGRLFPATATTPVHVTVLSALAEGADRLVVREAEEVFGADGVELAAVLPLEPEDYARDFQTETSRAEFEALRRRATSIPVPAAPGLTREEAYWQAGREIVDRSDVLLAVWDGRPAAGTGGTGEVVDYARQCGVAVVTVPASADGDALPAQEPADLDSGGPPRLQRAHEALARLREFNADAPGLAAVARDVERQRAWAPQIDDASVRELFAAVAGWARPRFVRAELRARRWQRRYLLVVDALFALAAIAVVAVGYQISFQPERAKLALVETAALVLLVAAFVVGRRLRLHDRWIAFRSLAEAFRSSLFIAVTGSGEESVEAGASISRSEDWFQRAFTEAWARHPRVSPDHCDAGALRDLLAGAWVEDQIHYHRRAAERAERRHTTVTRVVEVLLGVAIVFSLMHAFAVFEEEGAFGHHASLAHGLEWMAIALPGMSAALTGHREHRQYRLNAKRSRRTAERLRRVRLELAAAPDLPAVRRLALEAQVIMVEENRDWFGVVELQDLEVSL